MKFRAAILVATGEPLVIEDIESQPLSYGQVLIKILCSSICGAQINEIDAVKGPDKFLPHLLGHEATGIVMDCGPGVTRIKTGDRVVLHWRKSAGIQSSTPWFASKKLGRVHAGWVTTFSEYSVVSENRLTVIPADFDPESAALMGCAATTAFGVINNDAAVRIGESVAVFGAGGVGLNVVQAAAMVSAYPIIAVDLYDTKLALARNLGATHTINSQKTNPAEVIRRIAGPEGLDVTIDMTGNVQVIQMAYELTAAQGRTILVGVPRKGEKVSIYTLPLHFRKVLKGSEGGSTQPDIDIPRYVRLCQSGKLNLKQLVTNRYSLADINTAIANLRAGEIAGRCVVNMS